ncbi:MAG: hypothetical protein V1797_18305 [Pseudomonadota bacterium]
MTWPAPRPGFFGPHQAWLLWPLAAAALASFLLGLRAKGRAGLWSWPLRGRWGRAGAWALATGLAVLALGSFLWNLHRALPFLHGPAYGIFALTLDAATLAALHGVGFLALARAPRGWSGWLAWALLLATLASGLILEAGRLAVWHPDGAWFEPLGWRLAQRWAWGGPSDAALHWLWWSHVGLALICLAAWPWLISRSVRGLPPAR